MTWCSAQFASGQPVRFRLVGWLCVMLLPLALQAHAPSDTFLSFTLTQTNLSGRWEIALRDLQHALGLDRPDAAVTSSPQLHLRQEALALDTLSGLTVALDGKKVPLRVVDEQLITKANGDAMVLTFES